MNRTILEGSVASSGAGDREIGGGDTKWFTMESAFKGASNMAYKATDAPDLSDVASMETLW